MTTTPKKLATLCLLATIFVLAQAQVDCISNPQNAACEDYIFPSSTSIVTSFCAMMDNMPGCTIYHTCQNSAYNASTQGNGVCTYFSIATDLCFDMPGMDAQSCGNLTKMCHPTTGTTAVKQCATPDLTATMPTYSQLTTNFSALCATNPPSTSLCSQCQASSGYNCDLLSTYVAACALAPTRPECTGASVFCNSVSAYNWPVCNTAPAPAPVAPTAPAALNCALTPSNPACADYHFADPSGVVKDMCTMMGTMPACSVRSRVCGNSKYSSSEYCEPLSLMADVCTDMTMGVTGCVLYQNVCTTTTAVKECSEPSLKNVLPTTMVARNQIKAICDSMPMSDCSACSSGSCDYLTVYSNLCMAMPTMSQCGAWSTMCAAVPNWPYCSSDASGIPEMRMYFHTGFVDYVLFYGWVPRTPVQYAFTWIAIAVAGILLEFVKFIRARLEKKWLQTSSQYIGVTNSSEEDMGHHHHHSSPRTSEYPPWSWRVDIPRSFLASFELLWGYALMLVAMTFNVGLFFAVVFGCFAGTLIFGRFLVTLPKAKTASCH